MSQSCGRTLTKRVVGSYDIFGTSPLITELDAIAAQYDCHLWIAKHTNAIQIFCNELNFKKNFKQYGSCTDGIADYIRELTNKKYFTNVQCPNWKKEILMSTRNPFIDKITNKARSMKCRFEIGDKANGFMSIWTPNIEFGDWLKKEMINEINNEIKTVHFKIDAVYHPILFSKSMKKTDEFNDLTSALLLSKSNYNISCLFRKYWDDFIRYQTPNELLSITDYEAPLKLNDNWQRKANVWINVRMITDGKPARTHNVDGSISNIFEMAAAESYRKQRILNQFKKRFEKVIIENICHQCKEIEIKKHVQRVFTSLYGTYQLIPALGNENSFIDNEKIPDLIDKLYLSTIKPDVITYYCDVYQNNMNMKDPNVKFTADIADMVPEIDMQSAMEKEELLVQQLHHWINIIESKSHVVDVTFDNSNQALHICEVFVRKFITADGNGIDNGHRPTVKEFYDKKDDKFKIVLFTMNDELMDIYISTMNEIISMTKDKTLHNSYFLPVMLGHVGGQIADISKATGCEIKISRMNNKDRRVQDAYYWIGKTALTRSKSIFVNLSYSSLDGNKQGLEKCDKIINHINESILTIKINCRQYQILAANHMHLSRTIADSTNCALSLDFCTCDKLYVYGKESSLKKLETKLNKLFDTFNAGSIHLK